MEISYERCSPALQYRANGTVGMRSRVTPGKCIPVVIDA